MNLLSTSNATQRLACKILFKYTACDIADVLLKLKVPNAGYLSNLNLVTTKNTTTGAKDTAQITVAPASTVLFEPKFTSETEHSQCQLNNIPAGTHWADLTPPDTILVMSQPESQNCAVLGGILALRIKMLGAKGVVVSGRVRDVLELNSTGLSIWSRGTSIVGAAAESKPLATQVPLNINGTMVTPGDIIFCDSINGVLVIPQERVTEVVDLLPALVKMDDRVKKDVMSGVSVFDAFAKHRR
ncbi:Protein DlpA [Erysiphe neolycopersici]|uniref:Protein DlpA n=1 Tax=Erysiphe neolycopersici TaxID=212602 RepID=A0A420HTX6_9PEZI|nr:Protein DlpA [Erysiphe neolycopersici]